MLFICYLSSDPSTTIINVTLKSNIRYECIWFWFICNYNGIKFECCVCACTHTNTICKKYILWMAQIFEIQLELIRNSQSCCLILVVWLFCCCWSHWNLWLKKKLSNSGHKFKAKCLNAKQKKTVDVRPQSKSLYALNASLFTKIQWRND